MGEMTQDLEGHHQVQRSRIINHPTHSSPILMTQYGWAKRGHPTNWYETKIEPIEAKLLAVNGFSCDATEKNGGQA